MAARRSDEQWFTQNKDGGFGRQFTGNNRAPRPAIQTPAPSEDRILAKPLSAPAQILLAEDDADMRVFLAQVLSGEGYIVTECANGIQLLDHLAGLLHHRPLQVFDVVISDIRMPGLTGLEILRGLHGDADMPPTILITAFGDDKTHAEAERFGAVATLDKPFEVEDLLTMIRRILGFHFGC